MLGLDQNRLLFHELAHNIRLLATDSDTRWRQESECLSNEMDGLFLKGVKKSPPAWSGIRQHSVSNCKAGSS